MPVEAVRIAPGAYLLQHDEIEVGLEFLAGGVTYEIVGEPASVGYKHVLVKVRTLDGRNQGLEFTADLRAGDRTA